MSETLLLTGCIRPIGNILSKKQENLIFENRLKQYKRAILYYITRSEFKNIIFCDNSNFRDPIFDEILGIAKNINKKFEYITYDGNKHSKTYGYGYSECEIFDYALENSKLLKQSESWYKITGRYIIKDINKLIQLTNKHAFYFHKQGIFDSWMTVSTSFFKVNRDVYQKYLYKKHIKFYEEFHKKEYYKNYLLNGSFPVEKVFYILLKDILITNKEKINYSVPVYYTFPSSLPKYINNALGEIVRKYIYKTYYLFKLDILFSTIHMIYHKIFFNKIYTKLIKDNII